MDSYNHSDVQDVASRLKSYRFGQTVSLRRVPYGVENSVFYADGEDGARMIVTILRKKNIILAGEYAKTLKDLTTAGFPVPEIVPSALGAPLADETEPPMLVFRRIDGVHFRGAGVERLDEIGRMLGRVHCSGIQSKLCADFAVDDHGLDLGCQVFGDRLEGLRKFAMRFVDNYFLSKSDMVLVHGDLFPDNILIDRLGRLHLIDWDDGGMGSRILDVAMAVVGLCLEGSKANQRVSTFLRGYRSSGAGDIDVATLRCAVSYCCLKVSLGRLYRARGHVDQRVIDVIEAGEATVRGDGIWAQR